MKIFWIILCFLFSNCTIQKSKSDALYFKPKLIFSNTNEPSNEKINKSAKRKSSEINFSILPLEIPENFPNEYKSILQQDINSLWKIEISKNIEYEANDNFILKNNIDVFIKTIIQQKDNFFDIKQDLIQPNTNYKFSSIDFKVEIEKQDLKNNLFYKSDLGITPIQKILPKEYKLINLPSRKEIKENLENTKKQEFQILTSSLDTELKINSKKIGILPIKSIFLDEGEHTFTFERIGSEREVKKYYSIPGKKRIVQHEWEIENSNSSIHIVNIPSGQKTILDRNKTEQTYFNLSIGKHSLEFFTLNPEIKKAEIEFFIKRNESLTFVFPIEIKNGFDLDLGIWNNKTENTLINENLTFLNRKKMNHELYSNFIVPINLEINSAFFLYNENERTEISFTIFTEKDFFSIQCKEEKIYLFTNSQKVDTSYKFNGLFIKDSRPFQIKLNKEKSTAEFYLSDSKIFERTWDMNQAFQIKIDANSEFEDKILALKYLQIKEIN